ncbi:hypothetical protein [Streptomyces sp. NPDC002187]|uniref:hypothetical protein n=1 Tax=Streptomyces sp. NPDC002187 TaxID=3364637 RepID=UPI0036A633DD
MGRTKAAPTTLLILLLATACSGPDDGEGASRTSSPRPSSTGVSSAAEAEPTASSKQPNLDLPKAAKVLVPLTKGTGSRDIPDFKPVKDVYTVHATCSGKGEMTIVDRTNPDDEPSKIGCDGPITIGRVYTDITTQKLSVRIQGGTVNWTLAIVSGEHAM